MMPWKYIRRNNKLYKVKFYSGNYRDRQLAANRDKCIAYVEHHFNSTTGPSASYTMVITGSNASETSKNWGRWYAQAVSREFNISLGGDNGVLVGGFNGRGDYNVKFTAMPAILLEPFFISNPQQADWLTDVKCQESLAKILCDSIRRFFPNGGTVAFSIGHKGKKSRPQDRGATMINGAGMEADYAELVLRLAKDMLENEEESEEDQGRTITIKEDKEVIFKKGIDEDANILWDPVRGILNIQ